MIAFAVQKHPPYLDLLNFDKTKYPVPLAFSSRDHCSLMEVIDGSQLNYIGISTCFVSVNIIIYRLGTWR